MEYKVITPIQVSSNLTSLKLYLGWTQIVYVRLNCTQNKYDYDTIVNKSVQEKSCSFSRSILHSYLNPSQATYTIKLDILKLVIFNGKWTLHNIFYFIQSTQKKAVQN